nr:hypothetical protein [uncultured Methanolobus sp.]
MSDKKCMVKVKIEYSYEVDYDADKKVVVGRVFKDIDDMLCEHYPEDLVLYDCDTHVRLHLPKVSEMNVDVNEIISDFKHGGMHFLHVGIFLYVNGKKFSLIGEEKRSESEYLSIFKKYSKGC